MYRYLLVDNDNTLMDFSAAEHAAIRETLHEAGLPEDDAACALYASINDAQWKALERGETTQDRLRVRRFELLLDALGRNGADGAALSRLYSERLGCHAELLPGAEELLAALRPWMKIAIVSNGVSEIQHARFSRSPLMQYADTVFISGEEGIAKPDPRVIRTVLERLGCEDPREAVFLGDSPTADIACAAAAGIDSILMSATKADDRARQTVASPEEARQLLMKQTVGFRPAVPEDGAACADIQRPYIEKTSVNFLYEPLTGAQFAEKIRSLTPRYPFIVAETPEGVAGFAYASALRPHDAYMWDTESSVYIREDLRGQGIGRMLYRRLLKLLDAQGFLNTYGCVTEPNEPSVALHRSLGFRMLGSFPSTGFKRGAWHGVSWLCRMPERYPECPEIPVSTDRIDMEELLS